MQECAPPPPKTVARDCGWSLPLFVCPPPHPRGDRDLSACLVLSPPDQGGDVCNYRLRALESATLWAVVPFWHCLVSGTPSLSYMICPELVQCVPSPLGKRVTVQGPVKEQQLDGMSHRGFGANEAHPEPDLRLV